MAIELTTDERTSLAEALLAGALAQLHWTPTWGIAGLGAAEAVVKVGDQDVRLTISVNSAPQALSILQTAIAHRNCTGGSNPV